MKKQSLIQFLLSENKMINFYHNFFLNQIHIQHIFEIYVGRNSKLEHLK